MENLNKNRSHKWIFHSCIQRYFALKIFRINTQEKLFLETRQLCLLFCPWVVKGNLWRRIVCLGKNVNLEKESWSSWPLLFQVKCLHCQTFSLGLQGNSYGLLKIHSQNYSNFVISKINWFHHIEKELKVHTFCFNLDIKCLLFPFLICPEEKYVTWYENIYFGCYGRDYHSYHVFKVCFGIAQYKVYYQSVLSN